ncbi:hypothetical protein HHK36_017977 [Tetracentron sinense]|uniref:Nuclear transcription factor Y subunit n=1 Tax=Tetracentron sinense TaxID=13715 RepID=A0A834YZ34_TETSI|nr:hypothetical protein HHK36_017977 [Tetracentron sinense]
MHTVCFKEYGGSVSNPIAQSSPVPSVHWWSAAGSQPIHGESFGKMKSLSMNQPSAGDQLLATTPREARQAQSGIDQVHGKEKNSAQFAIFPRPDVLGPGECSSGLGPFSLLRWSYKVGPGFSSSLVGPGSEESALVLLESSVLRSPPLAFVGEGYPEGSPALRSSSAELMLGSKHSQEGLNPEGHVDGKLIGCESLSGSDPSVGVRQMDSGEGGSNQGSFLEATVSDARVWNNSTDMEVLKPQALEVSVSGSEAQIPSGSGRRTGLLGDLDSSPKGGGVKGFEAEASIQLPGDSKDSGMGGKTQKFQAAISGQSSLPEYHARFELGFGQPVVYASYPYIDQCYSVFATYGAQTTGRMLLPLNVTTEDGPIYVNAKQYHGIIRRRQSRAKAEVENKVIKLRKPYLHESRHLHAVRRARGCGGRFLNTKNGKSRNARSDMKKAGDGQLSHPTGSSSYEILQSRSGNLHSSKEACGSRSNLLRSEVTSTCSRGDQNCFRTDQLHASAFQSVSNNIDGGQGMTTPNKWVAAADGCRDLKV